MNVGTLSIITLLSSVLLPGLLAQNVHRVGAGQPFTSIQPAIEAAASGDIIAVDAGIYSGFSLDRAVTILTEPVGALVETDTPTSIGLPSGAHARLCGLRMQGVQCQGAGVASFEQCEVLGTSVTPAVAMTGGSAIFWRCRLADGLGGIRASAARIALVQCDIASTATGFYNASISALDLRNGSIAHVASSTLAAGNGYQVAGAWPGVLVVSSQLDIVDSTIQGGSYAGQFTVAGGSAISATSDATVRIWRCVLSPGTGTSGTGQPTTGPIRSTELPGVSVAEPMLSLGSTMTTVFQVEPSRLVMVMATLMLSPPAPAPLVTQLHWGFAPSQGVVVASLVSDASGIATYALSIPATPSLRGLGVWLTGATFGGLPVALTPPIGGVVR